MVKSIDTLVVIPARSGSKGVPEKNIKLLDGKPLFGYTLDTARWIVQDSDICFTTDSPQYMKAAERYGLKVPFIRPQSLASDSSGLYDVLLHALDYYKHKGRTYKRLLLLQPTSPFRKRTDLLNMLSLYTSDIDMVVSVGASPHNPYFSLMEEDEEGYLKKCKSGDFKTRQECPPVYYLNGSAYLINVNSLLAHPLSEFTRVKKYEMDDICSLDIDTQIDWITAEAILNGGYFRHENN